MKERGQEGVRHPSKLTIFSYNKWSRNQMKVIHKKFQISSKLRQKLINCPKKQKKKFHT